HNVIAEDVYSVGANRSSQTNQPARPAQPEANVGAGSQVGTVKVPDGSQRNVSHVNVDSHVTFPEIATNTQLVKDSRKTLQDMDQKIQTVKSKSWTKENAYLADHRLSARQDVSARSTVKSLEATVLHHRTLLDADTSSREQPSKPLPIMHPACGPSIGDDESSDTSPEHQPANGSSNHSHGGCCSTPNFTIQPFDENPKNYARFKAKFRALYENEYNGSPCPPVYS
ncbi:Uncharacterized protein APZ42_031840, partial [Daphnia magna]